MATGLLIITTGAGTKFSDDFMGMDKAYSGMRGVHKCRPWVLKERVGRQFGQQVTEAYCLEPSLWTTLLQGMASRTGPFIHLFKHRGALLCVETMMHRWQVL
jgi:hypothetical protein